MHVAHLVEVLQQIQNSTSNLLLSEPRAGSVASHCGNRGRRRRDSRCDEGAANGCCADSWGGGAGARLREGSGRAEESGAEHLDRIVWRCRGTVQGVRGYLLMWLQCDLEALSQMTAAREKRERDFPLLLAE